MLQNELLPRLMQKGQRLVSHELHFYGIGESELEYKLHDLMAESTNPTIAPYAGTGEVKLRVTASLPEGEDAEALLQPALPPRRTPQQNARRCSIRSLTKS